MESQEVREIVLPTRPQPDTLVAIFILKTFGEKVFPGVGAAGISVVSVLGEGSEKEYEEKGTLLLDIGGGRFDHHNRVPQTTTSKLVAEFLGVADHPALAKLLEYAQRDDFYGKGTVSADPLDRAFGLSALVAALNKEYPKHPEKVLSAVLPLLEAHYHEEQRRTDELPKELEEKRANGKTVEFEVRQHGKKLKVIMIHSDNPSLAGFLRSALGGKYDIVLQRSATGHTNILTRPAKHVDLRSLAAAIRLKEAEKRMLDLPETPYAEFTQSGRIDAIPQWYYDRATNSIQNGGLNPQGVEPTSITWEEFEILMRES